MVIVSNDRRTRKKNIQAIIQRLVHYSGYYSKYDLQRLVQDSAYYSKYDLQRLVHYSGYCSIYDLQSLVQDSGYYYKMSRVLFSVWFSIQGIIQNTTCSVWFRIQRIIKKSRVLVSVLFIIQGIILNTTCIVWFRIQRIIQNTTCSVGLLFRVLFKIRPAASGSGFIVLFKKIQGIIQLLVHYSGFYSKYDLQCLVQDSAIIQKCPGYYSASGSLFRVLFKI